MGIAYGKGWGSGSSSKPDPHTELLLHFDNSIGRYGIDSGVNNYTDVIFIEPAGSIEQYPPFVQGKWGMAVHSRNGEVRVLAANTPRLDFTQYQDATIEWWEYWNEVPSAGGAVMEMGSNLSLSAWTTGCLLGHYLEGKYVAMLKGDSSQNGRLNLGWGQDSVGQWVHRAIVKQGSVYKAYYNGNLMSQITSTATGLYTSYTAFNSRLQRTSGRVPARLLDEFRLSSVARYTSNFTPPTKPFK